MDFGADDRTGIGVVGIRGRLLWTRWIGDSHCSRIGHRFHLHGLRRNVVGGLDRRHSNRGYRNRFDRCVPLSWGIKREEASHVIQHAREAGKSSSFPPSGDVAQWWTFVAAFLTFAWDLFAQQRCFQRVTSAKKRTYGGSGTLLGGTFYFLFAFIPMFHRLFGHRDRPGQYIPLFEGPAEVAALDPTTAGGSDAEAAAPVG